MSGPTTVRPFQTRANHARYVPLWHFFATPLVIVLFAWAMLRLAQAPTARAVADALFMVAFVILFAYARHFALRVQNRVIRLEEQLRFQRLLPADLIARMSEFRTAHYIALRFASDAELPDLARTVLDQQITDKKQIKSMIREWRADYLRA